METIERCKLYNFKESSDGITLACPANYSVNHISVWTSILSVEINCSEPPSDLTFSLVAALFS
jgi:hypothetical protein